MYIKVPSPLPPPPPPPPTPSHLFFYYPQNINWQTSIKEIPSSHEQTFSMKTKANKTQEIDGSENNYAQLYQNLHSSVTKLKRNWTITVDAIKKKSTMIMVLTAQNKTATFGNRQHQPVRQYKWCINEQEHNKTHNWYKHNWPNPSQSLMQYSLQHLLWTLNKARSWTHVGHRDLSAVLQNTEVLPYICVSSLLTERLISTISTGKKYFSVCTILCMHQKRDTLDGPQEIIDGEEGLRANKLDLLRIT